MAKPRFFLVLLSVVFLSAAISFCEAAPAKMKPQDLYKKAQQLKEQHELLKAQELYQKILDDFSDFNKIDLVQKDLENVNVAVIFSNIPGPETITHTVKSGETISKIARKYHTTVDLIKLRNNLETNFIRVGQKLSVWNGKFNILVDKTQNVLLLKTGENVVKVYPVSTGKEDSTPVGEFTIMSRLPHPVWFHKGEVVPSDDPKNFLGTRWLGFNGSSGYGIHGTIEPQLIGQSVSSGCIRMRNEDVEELYPMIPEGTKVLIVE